MTVLFDRAIAATVGTAKYTGLRMVFKAHRTLRREPNTLELSIYNLAPESRARLTEEEPTAETPGLPILLEAGYTDAIQQLFLGRVREARTSRQGVDWMTTILAADGEAESRKARVNLSFKKGAKLDTVIAEVIKKLGVNADKALKAIKGGELRGKLTEFVNGFVASGGAMKVLTDLLGGAGYEASIQDGELQILQAGKPSDLPYVEIQATSGLIGVPEIGEKGRLKAQSLLNGSIIPGRTVAILSDVADIFGHFRVQDVVHQGDTHGQPWYSDIEGIPI